MTGPRPIDVRRVWSVAGLEGVELARATYTTQRFGRHAHDTLAVGVIERGTGEFWCRGGARIASTGALVLFAPGDVHTGGPGISGPLTYRMLYLDGALVARVSPETRDALSPPKFSDPVVSDPRLSSSLLSLHAALEDGPWAPEQDGPLFDLIGRLLSRHAGRRERSAARRDPAVVRRAREFLHAEYARSVSLSELALVVERHPAYLSRVFSKTLGLPPHQYLVQVRVQRASDLLRRGAAPAAAAAATGFADQSHLTRVFRRLLGITPGEYRRQHAR